MQAVSTAARVTRHVGGIGLQALLVFVIVAAVLLALAPIYRPASSLAGTGTAQAGKPSVTISFASGLRASGTWPLAGGAVAFAVATTGIKPADLNGLWVANKCSRNGAIVSAAYQPVLDGVTAPIGLQWGGGSASCIAYVWMFPETETPLKGASMTYQVAG